MNDLPLLATDDRRLIEHAAGLAIHLRFADLDERALRALAADHGEDLATAILYHRLRSAPACEALLGAPAGDSGPAPGSDAQQSGASWFPADSVLGVVPGAFWNRHTHTGAHGGRILEIARSLGIRAERVPTRPFGDVRENGRIIASWMEARHAAGERVLLVTLSKGTLDAASGAALLDNPVRASIAGWLSLSGLWSGTALVDWLDHHPFRRLLVRAALLLSGRPWTTIEALRRAEHRAAHIGELPARVISVVGIPLRRHLRHHWAPRAYERLNLFGPSDGAAILLSDLRAFPGEIYPLWGADHYLNPSWDISPLIARLLRECVRPRPQLKGPSADACVPTVRPPA